MSPKGTSFSESMVMLSATLVFATVSENVTGPPGSSSRIGLALLVTTMLEGVSRMITSALADPESALPSSSVAAAVTVSVSTSPGAPATAPLNEQE